MKQSKPIVYVGIVTYNSAPLIPRCIGALSRQTHKHVHIVVMDNYSSDNIASVMKRYPFVRFIQSSTNEGFGSGHNAIIRAVKPRAQDYYLALNPDAILDPGYIAGLVLSTRIHRAGWATGKLLKNKKTRTFYSAGHAILRDGYGYNIGYGHVDRGQYDKPREVFGAPGAAALYRGSLIHALSRRGAFFDPALFMYYEDIDIDWRATLRGFHCWYEPSAVAWHPGGTFPRHLEAEVLGNRYISVFKNAFLYDIVIYNLPLVCLHVFIRSCLTPRVGFLLFTKVVLAAYGVISDRTKVLVSRDVMHSWFAQGAREKSTQPTKPLQRVQNFFVRQRNQH